MITLLVYHLHGWTHLLAPSLFIDCCVIVVLIAVIKEQQRDKWCAEESRKDRLSEWIIENTPELSTKHDPVKRLHAVDGCQVFLGVDWVTVEHVLVLIYVSYCTYTQSDEASLNACIKDFRGTDLDKLFLKAEAWLRGEVADRRRFRREYDGPINEWMFMGNVTGVWWDDKDAECEVV